MKTRSNNASTAPNESLVKHAASSPRTRGLKRAYRLPVSRPPYRAVLAPLLRHDPININYGDGPEIYLAESEAILARLSACKNEEDVCRMVHEELCESFGLGAVGSRECCARIAREVWEFWKSFSTAAISDGWRRS